MKPADLADWQARLGLSQVEAARLLKMPVQTYRNLLKSRRHAKGLPGPIAKLCALVEKRSAPGLRMTQPHEVLTVTADEIRALDERSLVDLLNRLLHVEAEAAGLLQSGIHVPAQINVADEGEDGRIEWSGGPEHTAFLPTRLVQFQVKATDMGPAKCAAEMRDKSGALKQQIRDALAAGGAYVVFCNRPLTQAKIDERMAKMRAVVADAQLTAKNTAVLFWDANKIAAWTNAHYPVALWVIERIRPGGILPFQTLEKWEGDKSLSGFDFVADARAETVGREIETHLAQPKGVMRLVGLSGLGKTRLALEALRRAPSSIQSRVLYTHGGFGFEKILQVVQAIREYGKSAIVVVDDCSLELHKQLADVVEHAESRLSLLTIDYDPTRASADQVTLEIDRADNQVIIQIIKQVAQHLGDADTDRLAQFAQGFPQIAVLIAKAWPFAGQNISSLADAGLVEKMVFGRGQHDPELLRVARVLSIYDIVGLEGAYANEMKYVSKIARVDPQLIYGHVQTLIDRGLVQKRGRFVQVQPKPIALSLAVAMLQPLPVDQIGELVGAATPERLKQALFEQLSHLDRIERIREAAAKFCAPDGPFSDPAFLDDKVNAECLAKLAEINPAAAVGALERAFGAKATQELRQVTRGRRWLIWALDRVCFREETFHRAAKLMLDFAVAENEKRISNNATGMFKSLFKMYLSGTETPAIKRLSMIDDALSSSDPERRKIAIGALGQGLETRHFSRMGGAEAQGSGPALEDWAPTTNTELAAYYRECLSRLAKVATGQGDGRTDAKHEMAGNFRGLVGIGMIDDVGTAVDQLMAVDDAYWPEAVQQLSQSLRFEGPGFPPEYRQKVRALYDRLSPQSLEERLRLYVCELPWGYYEPGDESLEPWKKWAKILAEECGRQWEKFRSLIPRLVTGEQRYTYEFGKRILGFSPDSQGLIDLVERHLDAAPKKTAAPDLLGGILAAAEGRDPALVDRELDRIAENPNLVRFLPWLTLHTRIDDRDIARVVAALHEGKITPESARVLGMESVLAHLAPEQVAPLLDALLDAGGKGFWAAVEVLDMYVYQTVERYEGLRPQVRRILTGFEIDALGEGCAAMETHHFGRIAKWLLSRGAGDRDATAVAAKMAQEIVRWCVERPGNLVGVDLIEGVLRDLLQFQGDITWPVLTEGMAAHRDKLWAFEHPLGRGYSGEKSAAGVIFLVPWPALRVWCHRYPDFAPAFLMRVAPTFESGPAANAEPQPENKPETSRTGKNWHPIVLGLLDDFGDRKDVLSALSANMISFSWWGSLVPYFEQYLEPLNALLNHHRPSVVAWARQQLEAQSHDISSARRQDDEREFGVY